MLTVLRSFLAITNAATTVNDHWSAVILTADIHGSYLHIQKRRKKNAFYIVIILSFCWFILKYLISVWTFSFVIFYILFSVFSFFFSFLVLVNVHKLYKGIEQLYCYLEIPKTELHWVNGLLSKEVGFKLLVKLYPTYKTKRTKKRKF